MPASPDFDQIAVSVATPHLSHCLKPLGTGERCVCGHDWQVSQLVEQLRLVWNARGAADAIVVAEDYDYLYAIKALDR